MKVKFKRTLLRRCSCGEGWKEEDGGTDYIHCQSLSDANEIIADWNRNGKLSTDIRWEYSLDCATD